MVPGGTSTAEDKGLISGGGAKIPHATECVKKKHTALHLHISSFKILEAKVTSG